MIVRTRDVVLGPEAQAAAARFRIPEPHVRLARSMSVSTYETPQWLMAISLLPDGRRVRMTCELHHPEHVVSLRLI